MCHTKLRQLIIYMQYKGKQPMLLRWIFHTKGCFGVSSRTNDRRSRKVKIVIIKITFEWKLQDLQE